MSHALFLESQNQLLALYHKARDDIHKCDLDYLRSEIKRIRDVAEASDCIITRKSFNRFLSLISSRVGDDFTWAALEVGAEKVRNTNGMDTKKYLAPEYLPEIMESGIDGISLVTCCMNRNGNLIKALPSWLQHTEINEIVIVDWSSEPYVAEELKNHAIHDSRIRLIRVNYEPRWILSYAFNVGFRMTRYNKILKVDADIILSANFFEANHLGSDEFIAGNWRNVEKSQVYTNGFFFAPRKALYEVGGFNEYITTYGWDDDDIYERMISSGFHRIDVESDSVFHLEHSDQERVGEYILDTEGLSAIEAIISETGYKIRRNRYIAKVMPIWSSRSQKMIYEISVRSERDVQLIRHKWSPASVPQYIDQQADFIALLDIANWRLGKRVLVLNEVGLRNLLSKPIGKISKLDIEIAIRYPMFNVKSINKYCVIEINSLRKASQDAKSKSALSRLIERVYIKLKNSGIQLVISSPMTSNPLPFETVSEIPFLPSWIELGKLKNISLDQLDQNINSYEFNTRIQINPSDYIQNKKIAPKYISSRARLYIDAQHGLGNRLRAIGSASAIAEASGRELVIVWQPDCHCDCYFTDLFEYYGPLENSSFIADAQNCDVYNYMVVENGADKGKRIETNSTRDIYARSAFVLNSPNSNWGRENHFIQSLRPVKKVRDLIRSVRHPNDVSVHVRMEGGKKDEHLPYESIKNWTEKDHDLIDYWRSKSHFSNFMKRIDELIAEEQVERIFIAADMIETYEEFRSRYHSKIAWLPRDLYDRSAGQLCYALADAVLLSRSPLLLGSTWSAFSELAIRLAPKKMKVEMSGKDF